jgi:carboxyl-terminal processing protease
MAGSRSTLSARNAYPNAYATGDNLSKILRKISQMKRHTLLRRFLLGSIAGAMGLGIAVAQKSHDTAVKHNLTIFTQIVNELETGFVDTINSDAMIHTAIDAMLSTLDPYTTYYTDKEQEEFESHSKGEFGGIGVYMSSFNGNVYLTSPHEGGPADRAGIKSGDKVIRVDTIDTKGFTTSQVSNLLRGEPGTPVHVTLVRPFVTDSIVTVDIVREKISIPAVDYYCVNDDEIGYISLTGFSEKAAEEFGAALADFKTNHPNLKGIVIDLADNGGGLLNQAVEILGMFLPKGTVVTSTKGRDEEERRTYRTSKEPVYPDIPLAVLINSGSASAAEIVAGALQDLDRAVLIGNRSFGKGLVQTTRQLPYGHMLKYTTSKYYIPSGRLIQAIDYSHRNEDGSAKNIPDSLTTVFYTKAGREVRDGGGLKPDVEVTDSVLTNFAYELVRGDQLYNFANEYAATHESIASPKVFNITDEDYALLAQRLKESNFKYSNESVNILEQVRAKADKEGYLTDSVASEIDALKEKLQPNLEKDLRDNREFVESILVSWICDRYYYDKGRAEAALRYNIFYDKALEILSDTKRYNSILKKK